MIPHKVYIKGFKRFKEAKVHLDRKVLAFVGPNEAGKSSFLEALLSLEEHEDGDVYHTGQLTKGLTLKPKDVVVKVDYLLEEEEINHLTKIHGTGKPRYYRIFKLVDGTNKHKIIGEIARDKTARKNFVEFIEKSLRNNSFKSTLDQNYHNPEGVEVTDELDSLRDLFENVTKYLKSNDEEIDDSGWETLDHIFDILDHESAARTKAAKGLIKKYFELDNELRQFEGDAHPRNQFLTFCDQKRPKFVLFDNQSRLFKNSYSAEQLEQEFAPSAILNLIKLAKIEMTKLMGAMTDNDRSERMDIQNLANENLKNIFEEAWSQSGVYPQLLIDPDSLSIQIFSSGRHSEITSRSEGLKQYIALIAFLSINYENLPTVLLIDEAEIHLHYAAQADLVKQFEEQKLVNSIIYTTHSAGCLPSDLGTGIRAVHQIMEENDQDSGESIIKNSIWSNDGGFSPILFAMGANIIAFTLARKAVITEGPCETILLPRLLREVGERETLDFQVAPGIATISKAKAKDFEFEAATEVYIVDGDEGGKSNKRKLVSGGISSDKIFLLDTDCSIEDYVSSDILINAINRELEKAGMDPFDFDTKKIPSKNKIGWLEDQMKAKGIKFPNKMSISENCVKVESTSLIVEPKKAKSLLKLLEKIEKRLS